MLCSSARLTLALEDVTKAAVVDRDFFRMRVEFIGELVGF
jgi:hypothetical protein